MRFANKTNVFSFYPVTSSRPPASAERQNRERGARAFIVSEALQEGAEEESDSNDDEDEQPTSQDTQFIAGDNEGGGPRKYSVGAQALRRRFDGAGGRACPAVFPPGIRRQRGSGRCNSISICSCWTAWIYLATYMQGTRRNLTLHRPWCSPT